MPIQLLLAAGASVMCFAAIYLLEHAQTLFSPPLTSPFCPSPRPFPTLAARGPKRKLPDNTTEGITSWGRRLIGVVAAIMALANANSLHLLATLPFSSTPPVMNSELITAAALIYDKLWQEGVLAEAGKPSGVRSQRGQFCFIWLWHLFRYRSLQDKQRSGREPKLANEDVKTASKAIASEAKSGNRKAVRTMQTCKSIPTVASILERTGASIKTLFHRMKLMGWIKRVRVYFKKPLDAELMDARCQTTEDWLVAGVKAKAAGVTTTNARMSDRGRKIPIPPDPLKRPNNKKQKEALRRAYAGEWLQPWAQQIVWMDAKKLYVCPKTYMIWSDDHPLTVEDSRLVSSRPWVLHYYSAVNYKYGGVLIKLVSGTQGKGYKGGKYKVRRAASAGNAGLQGGRASNVVTTVQGQTTHQRGAGLGRCHRSTLPWSPPRLAQPCAPSAVDRQHAGAQRESLPLKPSQTSPCQHAAGPEGTCRACYSTHAASRQLPPQFCAAPGARNRTPCAAAQPGAPTR